MTLDGRTRWFALYRLCLGTLMIVLDSTIVNVALPSIRTDLGFSQTSLAWVVNAYLLTFGGFLLLGGRLGDLYGPRRLFLGRDRALHDRVARLRALDLAGPADRRAGGAGARRRRRLRGLAVADDDALHRACRSREGDGRLRLRRLGRRHARRPARRRSHRRAQLALDLPRQPADRDPRHGARAAAAARRAVARPHAAARRRRRDHRHLGARDRRLRDRQRERRRAGRRRRRSGSSRPRRRCSRCSAPSRRRSRRR